jgi:hypothetical protein
MVLAGLALTGCGPSKPSQPEASGQATVSASSLRDFSAVELAGPDNVDIRRGDSFAIRVEGDKATTERIALRVTDGTLHIDRKREDGLWNRTHSGTATVHVTMPTIRGVALTGSGDIAIDRADDLTATLAGAGDITIGQLGGKAATLTVVGPGTIAAAGAVERLALSIAGPGDIQAREVEADQAVVSITGSGDATAAVNGPATVSLVGSGSATLGANARCSVSKVGSGEAHCG